jgi:hypothetical protein
MGVEVQIQPKKVEMHYPKGWQFTMPKGDPVKGRASLRLLKKEFPNVRKHVIP